MQRAPDNDWTELTVPWLRVDPVTELPARVAVGAGTALFVDGRCVHSPPIRKLIVTVEINAHAAVRREEHPALGWGMSSPDGLAGDNDYWWAIVTLPSVDTPQEARIGIRAQLRDGNEVSGLLGVVPLVPRLEPADVGLPSVREEARTAPSTCSRVPLVAVCMATYNPKPELLRRQVESIRAQTHDNWICLISDASSSVEGTATVKEVIGGDDRFHLSVYGKRLGVYENFERALLMVPPEAEFVALSDQDDHWRRDKLERLLTGIEAGARLAYSDARIVDTVGRVIGESLWQGDGASYARFTWFMLTARASIPGAAMLFESSLLNDILPFPPGYPQDDCYHDFWIARVAMALGTLCYVDAPLYDYVQHGEQTLGAPEPAAKRTARESIAGIRSRVAALCSRGIHPGWRRSYYFSDFLRMAVVARALEVRFGDRISGRKRRTLRAVADSPRGVAWLTVGSARQLLGAAETRGGERKILTGLLWRHSAEWNKRLRDHILGHRRK